MPATKHLAFHSQDAGLSDDCMPPSRPLSTAPYIDLSQHFDCAHRATTNRTNTGTAVAKLWCLPFRKNSHVNVETCNMDFAHDVMAKQTGFDRLAQDCGVENLVVRQWVEDVRAVMPHTGLSIIIIRSPGGHRHVCEACDICCRISGPALALSPAGYAIDLPGLFSEAAPGVTAAYMRKSKDKKVLSWIRHPRRKQLKRACRCSLYRACRGVS